MRRSFAIAILGAFTSTALAIAINVATGGSLPGVPARFQGWTWPAVAVLTLATVDVTLTGQRGELENKQPDLAAMPSAPPPAELPGDIPDFTGREALVATVRNLVEGAREAQATAVVVSAISGMAGIGKTALAVHVAHLVRTRFPDGQFHVNLRGAEAEALDPMAVLGDFLTQLGMVDLPGDLDGRTRAYRSRVADRRFLVLLDNAADEDQVRPLLPGSPSCAVIITSRVQLLGLAGARRVVLDVLGEDEAVTLLGQICGEERAASEREHAQEIARICGYLPIAIRIAGGVLAKQPRLSLAQFAEQLHRERPLTVLGSEGTDDVRISFSRSYRALREQEQRLFCLLGLFRAPDFPAWMGDVALDAPVISNTPASIGRLVDAQLLEDDRGQRDAAGQRRFRFHDLLREFARENAETAIPGAERRAALDRVLTRYLLLSTEASRRLRPVDRGGPLFAEADPPLRALDREPLRNGALAWFTAEHACLVSAVEQACDSGFAAISWRLAVSLEAFFERRALWDSWQRTGEVSLTSARAAGDAFGAAHVQRSLGYLARERGEPRQSLRYLEQSRSDFQAAGDAFGEAHVLCNMIRTYRDLGEFTKALECYESSLPVARSLGARWLEANILRDMGMVYRDHDYAADALACLESALPLFQETGDELLQTYTVRDIGMVHQQLGDEAASMSRFEEALAGFERLGDQRGAARALNSLAVGYSERHQWSDATAYFGKSLDIFHAIGDSRWEAFTLRRLGELHRELALNTRRPGSRHRTRARTEERNQWSIAEDHLRTSHRILDELDNQPWKAQTLLSLSRVLIDQSRWDEAVACLDECLMIFRATGNTKGQNDANELLDLARRKRE